MKNTQFNSHGIFELLPSTEKLLQMILYLEKQGSNLDYEDNKDILERAIKEALRAKNPS
ncbi:hypothetical protein [Flagellimonas marinaquae]